MKTKIDTPPILVFGTAAVVALILALVWRYGEGPYRLLAFFLIAIDVPLAFLIYSLFAATPLQFAKRVLIGLTLGTIIFLPIGYFIL